MNSQPKPSGANRRDFFRRSAYGGLAAVSAVLIARSVSHTCVNSGLCRGCGAFEDCSLPQALSAKQVLGNAPRTES